MKIMLQIDLPPSPSGAYRNLMAARRLLAGLALQAPSLPLPSDAQSPVRDDQGAYAGFWQVTP